MFIIIKRFEYLLKINQFFEFGFYIMFNILIMEKSCPCTRGGCAICGACDNYDRGTLLVIAILVIIVLYMIWSSTLNERYVGDGLTPMGANTSGATLRRSAQQFGSTNQDESNYIGDPGLDFVSQIVEYPSIDVVLSNPI